MYTMATTLTVDVLAVYRAILRQGRLQLKLTDQSFFRKMVREEFQKRKGERHSEEVQFQMQVSYFAFIVTLSLHSHADSQTFLADKSRWIIVTLMISKKTEMEAKPSPNHHRNETKNYRSDATVADSVQRLPYRSFCF